MSKRKKRAYRKYRTCTRKQSFGSQLTAMKVGAKRGLNWYRCPYCRKWHLTSRNTTSANHERIHDAEA